MGIGEPLDNKDNVLKFLELVNSPEGLNIGMRHISLSTCGIVPQIDRPDTVGKGWRLNIQEKLTPITKSGGLQTKLYDMGYRYIYSDADGTDHYFYYDENKKKTLDEDGLGLTLTVNSTVEDLEKYVITADARNSTTSFSSPMRT